MRLTKAAQRQAAEPCARLHASEPMSLSEVARLLHCSREGVRLIEISALSKLRAELARRGYDAEGLLGDGRADLGMHKPRLKRSE
ncbi:sigma factor-like helix-turn-helix DNA-binding protein [Variovorax sp. J22R24]|uniref:sigma factor-like helix-turn-helix DNA-binding protein n=1 Tax=Variovorax gracilis TaxID=3053502 RepID=UPI002575F977|nr:sigma factor-like helix-turn-helix DNA-binding protein [Variovorax sp. J22R24]MDM0107800.1 sigma factor-like helix-turn-helix DNA-binding protein [Variovorax sp. J22R24]